MKLVILFVLLFACQKQVDTFALAEEIKKADLDFSDLSKKVGMKKAFAEYVDENAVLLRPNDMPIVSAAKIIAMQSSIKDSLFTLTWAPLDATVAKSGELGYSYGLWELKHDTTVDKGTYVTIWKKNGKGEWKWCFDTGNDGLERKKL